LFGPAAPAPRSVVGRITAILLAFRSGGSYSITELARLTGLPLSTTHRLVGDLASWQLLRRNSDGLYGVGPNLQRLTGYVESIDTLDDLAPLAVNDLFEATHRRTRLGVLCGDRIFYVERRTTAAPPTRFSAAATLPAHATALGKALLAFSHGETVASLSRNLTAYTSETLTQPELLLRQLHMVRLTGIALGRGELVSQDCAIAAPVFGAKGEIKAALEVQVRNLSDDVQVCRPALVVAARCLSRELSRSSMQSTSPWRGDDYSFRSVRASLQLMPATD
jgi:DNA-binding IclR family transcriptional regulator